jgi:hypothetical protein
MVSLISFGISSDLTPLSEHSELLKVVVLYLLLSNMLHCLVVQGSKESKGIKLGENFAAGLCRGETSFHPMLGCR